MGLGLIGIGRPWGYRQKPLPDTAEVEALLRRALALDVRLFDTAASYGPGEARLGEVLRGLGPAALDGVTIATKFGDHWDAARGCAYVDHSYDALAASLERSLERLPRIDLLQVHKATRDVLAGDGLAKAIEMARAAGIPLFGASVKDTDSAAAALADERFLLVQFPYNSAFTDLERVFAIARAHGKMVLINRPFGEGRLLYGRDGNILASARGEALRFILRQRFKGWILTGTTSVAHLEENVSAFQDALRGARSPGALTS